MKAWAKGLVTSFLFVVVCLIVWGIWGHKLTPEKLPTPVDALNRLETEGAVDFKLPTLDGKLNDKLVQLSHFKGKIIILNFWATWCAPCVTEFPSMLRMAARLKDQVVLVTVAADERKDDVTAFIKSFKGTAVNVVHLYDPSTKTAESFGTVKLPETYIIGPNFKVAKKIVNSLEWDQAEVLTYLRNLAKTNSQGK